MSRKPVEIVASAVENHGSGREAVMEMLTDVNRELGYIPEEAIRAIAAAVGVSNAEIYSVLSFYSFFSTEPRGRNIVRLCKTISCEMNGSRDILAALESELGIKAGETTPDRRVTLETTSCIGLCDEGPAMLVNDTPHTRLTPEEARRIVAGLE
ncbi:MAG: NADH-quinone oxidoreductase subunit NuoE [Candidatus Fermentibacteraceae bacterium]|nr:NADH-quinone oxidoreductase subunit NuoE [Candidatus Fermentibacteraceae bacterium]MBN2608933.1 NADH-quinone oxidoreductase subunit NuoE [Candidatus Fermentibacteraceae bacterium]